MATPVIGERLVDGGQPVPTLLLRTWTPRQEAGQWMCHIAFACVGQDLGSWASRVPIPIQPFSGPDSKLPPSRKMFAKKNTMNLIRECE
jgi:hypothetical protein